MKTFYLFILSASLFAAPGPDGSANLGLVQAKKHAVAHNLEVLALKRSFEEANAATRQSRAAYFPALGVAGGADSEITAKNNQGVGVGFLYATYNLFNGFQDAYRVGISDLEAQKAQIRLEKTEFRVGLDVEQVFHLYLFKKSALTLRQEALKLNESHKKMVAQRKASGLSSDADIMEFDLRDSLLRSDILLLQQELESARVQLRRLLGEEVGAQIEPVGTLQHQHLKGSLMDYVNRVKSASERVLLASRSLQSANIESKIWLTKWFPRLEVDIKAGYLPLELRPSQGGASARAMVLAKFDFFSGFGTVGEKQEGEAKRLRSEAELKNSLLLAATEMEMAFRKIKTIQSRVDLEEQNANRSDKYYKAVLSEYRRGIKNSADLKVAAEQVYEAHLKREAYKYDFLNEKLALERALGEPIESEVVREEHEH